MLQAEPTNPESRVTCKIAKSEEFGTGISAGTTVGFFATEE
jgi:hypothetical protein